MTRSLKIAGQEPARVVDSARSPFSPAVTLGAGAQSAAHTARLQAVMDNAIGGVQIIAETPDFVLRRFAGYGRLQNLAQDAIIRLMVLTRTDEMLRNWIEWNDLDPEQAEAFDRFIVESDLRSVLQTAVSYMGFFGGAYIFIDTGADPSERINPLNISDRSDELKQGRRLKFRAIDPFFTTPQAFNASDPLADDFFKPQVFFVMGKPVHASRLIRIVENEVPDILKPSYNFLGLPHAQLLEDYVNDFRDDREAVNRLLKKFSTSVVKSNIGEFLYAEGSRAQVDKRIEAFVRYRNNDGVLLLDKETEDFMQTSAPISGLDALLSQALQFIVAINRTNVVKTLGLSPAGFNTGDSDIKVHNDLIASMQEKVLRKPLDVLLKCANLHLFGSAEPVPFKFAPLTEEDARAVADTAKVNADTTAIYLDRGVISPEEARDALKLDERSALSGVIEGDLPDTPDETDDPFADLRNEQKNQ